MIKEYVKSIIRGFESLAFDNSCTICGDPNSKFCDICRSEWSSNPRLLSGEEFPVASSITYGETASSIVLSAKENGSALARDLVVRELKVSIEELLRTRSVVDPRVLLVPIPSSRSSRVRRGGDFISQLTNTLAKDLNTTTKSRRYTSRSILTLRKRVVDQSGLSETQRYENLAGAFEVSPGFNSQIPIVVIDDVITTGNTLREAVRALKERNLTVLGAATACASRRRLPIR